MRFKSHLIILLVINLAIIAGLIIFHILEDRHPVSQDTNLFSLPMQEVRTITFGPESAPIQIQREGEFWRMQKPFAHAFVQPAAVSALLDTCQRLVRKSELPEAGDALLDHTISLATTDQTQAYYIGEPFKLYTNGLPIQPKLEDEATPRYAAEGDHLERLIASPESLRSTVLLPIDEARIETIECRAPGQPFLRITKARTGEWSVTQPRTVALKSSRMQEALDAFTKTPLKEILLPTLQSLSETAADGKTQDLSSEPFLVSYGLDEESACRISLTLSGNDKPLSYRFGKEDSANPGNVFCLMDGAQAIALVPMSVKDLFSSTGPFLDTVRLLPNTTPAITMPLAPTLLRVRRIDQPKSSTQLVSTNGVWSLELPVRHPADGAVVAAVLRSLTALAGTTENIRPPTTPALCELFLSNGDSKSDVTYRIYTDDATVTRLIRKEPNGQLLRIKASDLPLIFTEDTPDTTLADRSILQIPTDTISRITCTQPERQEVFYQRDDRLWIPVAPAGSEALTPAIERKLNLLNDLRAVRIMRFVSAQEAQSAEFSAENGSATLTLDITQGGSPRNILMISKPNAITGNAMLYVQGRPVIYEIDASTRKTLMEPITQKNPKHD